MPATRPHGEARIAAYCSATGLEVFSGIVHGNQICTPDPFDAELIHKDAREEFAKLLSRASTPEMPASGKMLLLLGEGGSGKTHLMRAFRAATHENGDGYCAYLQLATKTDHYGRYVLSKVIDSLELPYKAGLAETGLQRLARGLIDCIEVIPVEERRPLFQGILEPAEVTALVHRLAYMAVQLPRFQGHDINVIRAILFTLADDAPIHAAVIQWLRCEDLSRFDRELIGDMVPRPQSEMAAATIHSLGRLMHAVHDAAFVVLVDEMEAYFDRSGNEEERAADIRSAVNALVEIADSTPNAIVVVSCLEDYYKKAREHIPSTKLDRLERDPDTIRLNSQLTPEEITALVALRLKALFEAAGVEADSTKPVAPFTAEEIAGLAGFSTRDILDNLRKHHESCLDAGAWVPPSWKSSEGGAVEIPVDTTWPRRWNDFQAGYKASGLDEEPILAGLIEFAAMHLEKEFPVGNRFRATREDRFVRVEAEGFGNPNEKFLVAVCNKSTRGGGLGNQVKDAANKVGSDPAILVRSTEFPKDPKQVVSKEIAKLIAPIGKGRRVVVADADWRALGAFRDFHGQFGREPGFNEWQCTDRPLSGLTALRAILGLESRKLASASPIPLPPPAPPKTAAVPVVAKVAPKKPEPVIKPTKPGTVRLGRTRSSVPEPVEMDVADFRKHAAFLGGSGSGKTTAALTVIEQLLMRGIPAILLDRKGDLGGYADPDVWADPDSDPDRESRRKLFRERVEVVVYTPGSEKGRPLRIPIVPELAGMSTADSEQMAQVAAAGLTQMMGYHSRALDPKTVILQKAIEVLGRPGFAPVTVKALQQIVTDMDELLTNQTDGYEEKHFKKLGQDLLTLGHLHRRLLEVGEPVIVEELLGRSALDAGNRTRLSIINTQFLGDDSTVDFWVAQFLLCVDRWRAKSPSDELQAVLFFDEADKYLPAVGKPSTKAPMESLLKRARSAGIGIFLATQSPGDFDYKCRDQVSTWWIGKVKEAVALGKLKPMLDRRPDALDKLAGQSAGEFYLVRESGVNPILADRNLMPTSQLSEDRILEIASHRH